MHQRGLFYSPSETSDAGATERAAAILRTVLGCTLMMPPFSMRPIVLRSTPAFSASSTLDQKAPSLAARTFSPSMLLTSVVWLH